MFKFNFEVQEDDLNTEMVLDSQERPLDQNTKLEWFECEEISPNKHFSNIDLYKSNSICLNDFKIYYVHYEKQIKCLQNSIEEIGEADFNHSDLITAKYEGGAKIWECTFSLLNYMISSKLIENFSGKLVLDLGCGAGLLGIVASQNKAIVHFQDYNKDVLETITIPNYLINLLDANPIENMKAKFFAGDWYKYAEATKDSCKFDIILTSETIYNPSNQIKLLNTFAEKLKPNGIILLAAKTYYFGVGGGLRQFEELIEKDERFQSKVVWKSNVGVGKEILEIKFKN